MDLADDLAFFGLDPALAEARAEPEALWPAHQLAAEAFVAVSTQWRVVMGSMGALRFIGLDYAAAQAGLGLRGLTLTPDQWLQVQVIERAALAAMNEAVE